MESSDWAEGIDERGDISSKMTQECKPDYEGMINKLKKKLEVTCNFFQSCEEFILHGLRILNKGKLKDLIGHLHMEIQEKEKAIEKLMEKAEKES